MHPTISRSAVAGASVLLCIALVAHSALAGRAGFVARSGDWEIKPGVGIGKVRIGAAREQVRASLGKPRETHRWPGGLTEDRWSRAPKNDGDFPPYVSAVYRGARVVQIEVTSPTFRTVDGVTTQTKLGAIRRKFRAMRVTEYLYEDFRGLFYDQVRQGIAFYVGGQDDILPNYPPEAIIVHSPGVRVIPHPHGKPMRVETDKTVR